MVARSTLTLLLAAAGAHAHFTVGYPKPLSSSHDEQGTGPCGGITPDLATAEVTDFHVGGDNVATRTSHAQGNWLYRVTLDPRAAGNWTQVYPIVQQSGLGDFCAPLVSVPGEFVGKKGILSVVGGGGHGYLYACSALNFVEGVGQVQSSCKNGSSVAAQFVNDPDLAALASGSGAAPSGSGSGHSGHGASQTGGSTQATNPPSSAASSSSLSSVPILFAAALAAGVHVFFV